MHRWETQWWKTSNKPRSCGWMVQPWPFSQMSNTWQNAKRRRKKSAGKQLSSSRGACFICVLPTSPSTQMCHSRFPQYIARLTQSKDCRNSEIPWCQQEQWTSPKFVAEQTLKKKKLWIALLSFQCSFWVILYHNPRSRTTKLKQPIACK